MKKLKAMVLLAVVTMAGFQPVHAQDSGVVTIEGTRIRGNQEVPTVMYLVPWQPPKVEELQAPDEQLMVEHRFEPLERYEFQRLVRYHEAFNSEQVAVQQVKQ